MRSVSTFSVVARDQETGDLGVATASKFLAVGAVVPHAVAGVGAVATQSYANTSFGPRALAALAAGMTPELVSRGFAHSDPDHHLRQYGIVAADGAAVSFTGDGCHPWAGGRTGDGYAVQGNLLYGAEVIIALADTFEASRGPLAERLAQALLAADRAGGDARGRQGAALLVVREGGGYGGYDDRHVDLRVDDDPAPSERLAELLALHRLYAGPTDPADVAEVTGEVAERLTRVLVTAQVMPQSGSGDVEALMAAFRELAGRENLEERFQQGNRIDLTALAHLERRYPVDGA